MASEIRLLSLRSQVQAAVVDQNRQRAHGAMRQLLHCGPVVAEAILKLGREKGERAAMFEAAMLIGARKH